MNAPNDPTADVTPRQALAMYNAGTVSLLDVREPDEWANGHADGARLIPLGDLDPLAVDASKPIVVICRSGNRSGTAAMRLRQAGIVAHNMAGGMIAWSRDGLAVVVDGREAADPT